MQIDFNRLLIFYHVNNKIGLLRTAMRSLFFYALVLYKRKSADFFVVRYNYYFVYFK